jgi:hypothetical protein
VRPLFPGDFTEAGGAISYYLPLFRGRAFVGAGISAYQRWYDELAGGPVPEPGSEELPELDKRRDTYVEPTAHLILPNLLGHNVDLRVDYRYEHNQSNGHSPTSTTFPGESDPPVVATVERSADFENHVAGVHLVGRF